MTDQQTVWVIFDKDGPCNAKASEEEAFRYAVMYDSEVPEQGPHKIYKFERAWDQ